MTTSPSAGTAVKSSLRDASVDRLGCLVRHWTWADEAMARFERELAAGWDYDEDPLSDHPFGSYYHWCALLCALAEAALDQSLVPPLDLNSIRQDVDASLPKLTASRQLLTVIPTSLEEQPRIVDLLHDDNLSRLRRIHRAFGEAIRREQMSREIESLDP
jgi:hypothetical protein